MNDGYNIVKRTNTLSILNMVYCKCGTKKEHSGAIRRLDKSTLHFNNIFSCHLLFEQRVMEVEFDKCIKARASRVAVVL